MPSQIKCASRSWTSPPPVRQSPPLPSILRNLDANSKCHDPGLGVSFLVSPKGSKPPLVPIGANADGTKEFFEATIPDRDAPSIDRVYHSPRSERLPRSILPESGMICVRKDTRVLLIYAEAPTDITGDGTDVICPMRYRERDTEPEGFARPQRGREYPKWREHISTSFRDGFHVLKVRISGYEIREYATKNKIPISEAPLFGYVIYEDCSRPVPRTKFSLCPQVEVQSKAVIVIDVFGGANFAFDRLFHRDGPVSSHFNVVEYFASEPDDTLDAAAFRCTSSPPDICLIPSVGSLTEGMIQMKIFGNKNVKEVIEAAIHPDMLQVIILADANTKEQILLTPYFLRDFGHVFTERLGHGSIAKNAIHYFCSFLCGNLTGVDKVEEYFRSFYQRGHNVVRFDNHLQGAAHLCKPTVYYTNSLIQDHEVKREDLRRKGCLYRYIYFDVDYVLRVHIGSSRWKLLKIDRSNSLFIHDDHAVCREGSSDTSPLPISLLEEQLGLDINSTGPIGKDESRRHYLRNRQRSMYHLRYLLLKLAENMSPLSLETKNEIYVDQTPREIAYNKLCSSPLADASATNEHRFYEDVVNSIDSLPPPQRPRTILGFFGGGYQN